MPQPKQCESMADSEEKSKKFGRDGRNKAIWISSFRMLFSTTF
jgi:hypothetical protein